VLNPVAAGVDGLNFFVENMTIHQFGGTLVQETKIMSYKGMVDPMTGAEVDMNFQVAVDITFGEGSPILGSVSGTLAAIRNYIWQDVVGPLSAYIPS
jgi:hypothetical protein